MAHLQYIPGDPRLVDQLVYELKSKGIFDQFRKDCIADVDTRPAYQNLRQRVENSVTTFLSRQCWKPDLNKNQLREKLRKHILDGNYLEQGVERIVDQVVNPKVASVFIPKVEDLVYNYLGITRKKTTPVAETSNGKVNENDLLPTDLEAVSPGSVKSNEDKNEAMEILQGGDDSKMEIDIEKIKDDKDNVLDVEKDKTDDTRLSGISELTSNESMASIDKSSIPLPSEEIKLENIPAPESSPPISEKVKVELEKIELPQSPNLSTDIPLPDETPKSEKETYFKPVNSDDEDSSSDSSLRRNMSPLTPIRNFNNENSCDAQQAFEDEDNKTDKKETLELSTFRFTIESKATENSPDAVKIEKKETEQTNLSYQFNNQININTLNTPLYDDSSNSTHLQIDYESDANSKNNVENKVPEPDLTSGDSRKDKKSSDKRSSHKSSHRDSHRHSSSKDRRSDSKQSGKDGKSDKKSLKNDHKSSSKSSHKEKSSEREKRDEKKDKDRDSSKHRSSHKSSSSSHKDSKSHRSSSTSQRHSSSSKHSDEKRSSSSSHKDKEKSSDKYSKEKSSKESKSSSSSHRSDKDRKSSSSKSKSDDKEKQKKDKKDTDDHYSASGRGNHTRRSTDRDSNDGSSSSKGSHHPTSSKSSENKKESKGSASKSDNTSTSRDSTSPSDKDHVVNEKNKNELKSKNKDVPQVKPIVRIENHLETPISSPPRLPFVPDVTLKKPKFAANMQEARKLMKMRKFLDEEQKRMNQEAALLLEFQANVRPSMSQVYSSIPGPELEFACVTNSREMIIGDSQMHSEAGVSGNADNVEPRNDTISDILTAAQQVENIEDNNIDTEVNNLEVQNVEVSLEAQEITLENVPEATEGIVIESEIDDEVIQSDAATVQIESIIEAEITTCEMDVDTTIDDKTVQIIDNVSTDIKVPTEEVPDENDVKSYVIINETPTVEIANRRDEISYNDGIEAQLQSLMPDEDGSNRSEYFQVTIITEELSESEEIDDKSTTITEEANVPQISVEIEEDMPPNETPFEYFAEHEKYNAELERDRFSKFLKSYTKRFFSKKLHVINCDSYEESIIKEVSQNIGDFEIVNYYKNGHLKRTTAKNVVKNVNVSSEISLPVDTIINTNRSPMFSPVKSECSFELSSDYDAKLEEMVSKTSRKEIMEIILGNVTDEFTSEPSEMPTIDYCMDSNIESDTENTLKRKLCEVEASVNNNRQVLTPNKIRKLSGSDQISSTTEESEETSNNNVSNPIRSKYLGRARRVGLPRPRRSNLPNSPSSDKSVENYEQNTAQANGKMKARKVQRYDTSDLYKPKLHYLSRRNNIS